MPVSASAPIDLYYLPIDSDGSLLFVQRGNEQPSLLRSLLCLLAQILQNQKVCLTSFSHAESAYVDRP
jgi:hypothetical protein